MFPGIDVLMTRGTIDEIAWMFSLLFNSNHQFFTGGTFALVSTDADIHGVHDFSLVRCAKVLLKTGFSIKGMLSVVTWDQDRTTLSFGFSVIRADIL